MFNSFKTIVSTSGERFSINLNEVSKVYYSVEGTGENEVHKIQIDFVVRTSNFDRNDGNVGGLLRDHRFHRDIDIKNDDNKKFLRHLDLI